MLCLFFCAPKNSAAQCTILSPCGYTVRIAVTTLSIVPSSTDCTSGPGYNYNVRFAYTVTAVGSNSCFAGTLGVQPQIFCNSGQNNGYYTINNSIPLGAFSITDTGTLTTTTNPWRAVADCNTSTPNSLGCNSFQVTVFGPGISTITFTCGYNALPVQLYSFYGYTKNNAVVLKWLTASEKDNDFFSIEKSASATDWQTIGTKKGAGNSTRGREYTFIDESPLPYQNYYRIKQTDYDKTFSYSDIIFVGTKKENEVLRIFPNPASVEVVLLSENELVKKVELFNAQGILVLKTNFEKQIHLPLTTLESGVYTLRVDNGFTASYHKLIKN